MLVVLTVFGWIRGVVGFVLVQGGGFGCGFGFWIAIFGFAQWFFHCDTMTTVFVSGLFCSLLWLNGAFSLLRTIVLSCCTIVRICWIHCAVLCSPLCENVEDGGVEEALEGNFWVCSVVSRIVTAIMLFGAVLHGCSC